uniref:BHLH domain-containing protein n=1 Tax=Kalanchoe fedtschenkoi TaxID=63787 RepID=A0A7N1A2V0_KALFE
MGADLQLLLRDLCSNTGWHYAIYWKLRPHHSRMVLTWEDAYFGSCGHNESQDYLTSGSYLHDSLKLAMRAMSYDVYPFGEGIIGEVAASGNHRWVFGDKHVATSSSFVQEHNGWRSQFSAGIKTVAIIAVAPLGVVQLGSFYKIKENMKLADQIKHSLSALQISSVDVGAAGVQSNGGALGLPVDTDCRMLLHQESDTEQLGQIYSKLMDGITPQLEVRMDSDASGISPTCDMDSVHALHNLAFPFDDSGSGNSFPFHDSSNCESSDRVNFDLLDQYQDLHPSSHMNDKLDPQASLSHSESPAASLKFSTGCELHEALGPAFSKQLSNYDKRMEAGKVKPAVEFSEGMGSTSSQLAPSSGSEHLLEAVVANILNNIKDYKSDRACKSMQSVLTTDYMPEASSYGDHRNLSADPSSSYPSSGKDDIPHCLRTSEAYFTRSPTMLSSTCVSSCTEPVSKSSETSKGNKKRARPGEGSKPRPRDRQLIQDRIKELRELIPNGAKCSIDSLLERTIKHMQFMQSMSEHADKLKQCAESKMQSKDAVEGSSSHEQGSSWAVEVGGHLKVCRILVENVNMNRQMLIEMLCEECSHFLEIAEVIKSLGLTILKGATEACGDKTWICFLVEAQKNKSMQRLDILWSLVHVLQPKSSA